MSLPNHARAILAAKAAYSVSTAKRRLYVVFSLPAESTGYSPSLHQLYERNRACDSQRGFWSGECYHSTPVMAASGVVRGFETSQLNVPDRASRLR